ncbi:metallophosphoesterase family protein [Paenibacillus cymbidii]|uniref:metallophosphoesterase family protein n=1 Tax=Paenibacillus cymbidii TaxID=1639034 RepID=UPI001080AF39|nr:metallophosphoesterase family protein [Paenibacillus cymbidii]
MKPKLQFRGDRTFTIVQFTDLHWKRNHPANDKTKHLMNMVLRKEEPDLVVLTGDVIDSKHCCSDDPEAEAGRGGMDALAEVVDVLEKRHVPWAAVFGNHDAEFDVSKEQLMQVQERSPLCLTERGPAHLPGLGNYVLTIAGRDNERPAAALYLLDSLAYAPAPATGYDWIKPGQIRWYEERSAALHAAHGATLPSLAFFHIPLQEYEAVWKHGDCRGKKQEEVNCGPVNSGLFASLLEQGGVMGTFVGHDHLNDYWGDWHGIRLTYGRITGYGTYPQSGKRRGARLIRLTEGERQFETWLRLDDGKKHFQ